MPVITDPNDNFIQGLSSFWERFFLDTDQMKGLYEAVQIEMGQVYLELLQTVLGTSLEHAPLFSKRYFQLFRVREDQVAFQEGASPADDSYNYQPAETFTSIPTFMNRVIAPTAFLDDVVDFVLDSGIVKFAADPFTNPYFPIRHVNAVTFADLAQLRNLPWSTFGIVGGDILRVKFQTAAPVDVSIVAVQDRYLVLGSAPEALKIDFFNQFIARTLSLVYLRKPYDYAKTGLDVPETITEVRDLTVVTIGGFTVTVATPPPITDVGAYLFLQDSVHPENNGYVKITGVVGPAYGIFTSAPLATSTTTIAKFVSFTDNGPNTPTYSLVHSELVAGSVVVSGRRLYARTVDGIPYAAGEGLVEGVDYAINYDSGILSYLSIWDPLARPSLAYEWRILLGSELYSFQGDWLPGPSYAVGDITQQGGRKWVALVPTTAGSFIASEWIELIAPFRFNSEFVLREMALWAPDVLVDLDLLYLNFGYLLSFQRPSSENYRAFLRGVAQLFLLGPSLERFESAINVMANLPVVRTSGETLRAYDDGLMPLGGAPLAALTGSDRIGDRGEIIDTNYGNLGVLDVGTSSFTTSDPLYQGAWSAVLTYQIDDVVLQLGRRWKALTAPTVGTFIEAEWVEQLSLFLPTDIGVAIETRTTSNVIATYVVTAVSTDGMTATITPTPPTNETAVFWQYAHNLIRKRFSIRGVLTEYLFTDADVDGLLIVTDAREDRNQRTFRISAVESPRTVILEADAPLIDETGVRFEVSQSKTQTVTTDQHVYEIPIDVPIRADIADPASIGTLIFVAFEVLTDAVRVIDYVRDPTWWHDVTIPPEIFQMQTEVPGRRQVTPLMVEHLVNALDQAVVQDYGLMAGVDDEGEPGITRAGQAMWLGGPWVQLLFGAAVPTARVNDAGHYLVLRGVPYAGSYRIKTVQADGVTLELEGFPPPELTSIPPILLGEVELPPLLYRRTIPFILMDRFLKYHAFKVEIRAETLLTLEFLTDITALVKEAKPSYTYAYLEPLTTFVDRIRIREVFELAYGPYISEILQTIDNTLRVGTEMLVNEYFSYHRNTVSGILVGGLETLTVVPVFPFVPDRSKLLVVRFSAGTSGGQPLVEGVHYTVNYSTMQITITNGDAGAYTYDILLVALRIPGVPPSPWWAGVNSDVVSTEWYGETPVCVGGPDPLSRLNLGMVSGNDVGMVDRAIQIAIT